MANSQYKIQGSQKRKQVYTWAIVGFGLVIAVLITMGIITLAQVEDFISTWALAVGVLGGVVGVITSAMARKNVDPPTEQNLLG